MKKITFLKSDSVDLFYYPTLNRSESVWTGFTSSSDFRNVMDVMVKYAETNHMVSMLTNTLKQSPVTPEDLAYAAEKLQVLGSLGVRFFAFVMPSSAITKLGVKRFTSLNSSGSIIIGHFSSVDEATEWLDKEHLKVKA